MSKVLGKRESRYSGIIKWNYSNLKIFIKMCGLAVGYYLEIEENEMIYEI